ncbi:MAG: hypothetical protein IT561_28640 [Alphaproteobacteria bacterium]|nr:hypothetical protein [Alphaproteobacteria bacterium]
MRVRRITAWEFRRVFDPPVWNPATVWRERRAPLVTVATDDGRIGVGEAWCRQDEIVRSLAALETAAHALLGRNVEEIDLPLPSGEIDWPEAGAASALDIALWDIRARAAGLPLARLLNPAADTVAVYASGGLYGPGKGLDALAAEMAGYVAGGFAMAKMKIGGLAVAADLERVDAARAAMGDAGLIVDGVGSYDPETAAALARRLAERGVVAFQAPLADASPEALAALARRSPIPLVLGEGEWDHGRLARLVAAGAAGWLQANPGLAGGITGMKRLATLARDHGIPLSPQCHATAVLQAASIHLGVLDGVGPVELHRVHDHLHELMPEALRRPMGGSVAIPPAPGLGIAFPPASRDGNPDQAPDAGRGHIAPVAAWDAA